MKETLEQHPDTAAIRDWALYGPRNPEIACLVERLATERQMRLDEIEQLIIASLTAELRVA